MRFEYESLIPASPEAVFAFHQRPDALDLLFPPGERTVVLRRALGLEAGQKTILLTRVLPGLWMKVVAVHTECRPPEMFEDEMVRGPFTRWRHRHLFLPEEGGGCRLRDEIEYEPPFGILGRLIADPLVIRPRLRRMFAWRHEVTRREVMKGMEGEQAG